MNPTRKTGNVFDRLRASASVAPATPAEKPKARPTILLEGEDAELLDQLAGADAVLKVAGAGQIETRRQVTEIVRRLFLRLCADRKSLPDNPEVVTAQSKAGFQCKHVSGVKTEYGPGGDPITLPDQLRGAGFTEEVVTEIMYGAIALTESLRVRTLSEMQKSTSPAEQKVARKMAFLIDRGLTEDEKQLLLQRTVEMSVKDCWKDLAVSIACRLGGDDLEKRVEILGKLWEVLPVQFVVAQLSFGGEVSEAFGKLMKA